MKEKFFDEMKALLEERKADLEKQLKEVAEKSHRGENGYEAKFPQYGWTEDENADEVATYVNSLSLRDNLVSALDDVERALEKIRNGTYGVCEKCNQPIGEERLRVFPTARWCLACKAKMK